MEGIILLALGAVNVACFWVGARVGMAAGGGKRRLPLPSAPGKASRDIREAQEEQVRQTRLDAILRNLESYNGTAAGQEDIV